MESPILLVGGLKTNTWFAITKQSSCAFLPSSVHGVSLGVGLQKFGAWDAIPSLDSWGAAQSLFVHPGSKVLEEELSSLAE